MRDREAAQTMRYEKYRFSDGFDVGRDLIHPIQA